LRIIAALPRTTAANDMVTTPEYTARKRGLERNFILTSFLSEEAARQAASILAAEDNEQELFCLKAETQASARSSGYSNPQVRPTSLS
jgi:hypothetical protein